MPDILYDAAIAYSQIVKYDYHYILGDGNRKKIFSIITNEKDMFSHVCGLDHLKDIPKVTTNKSYMKEKIFKDILDKKITFLDIASSIHLYEKMSSKINPNTHSFYNIYDRIVHLCDILNLLDNSDKGIMYRWKCHGHDRYSNIRADYVFVINSDEYHEEKHYFFLVETAKKIHTYARNDICGLPPIKLKILSAFADCDDLTKGLGHPYTVLEVSKIEINTQNVIFTKTHKSYQKEKDTAAALSKCHQIEEWGSKLEQKVEQEHGIKKEVPETNRGSR